jgi:DeoR family fructose operon transcriptional repressor
MTAMQGNLATEERLRWLTERLKGDGALTIAEAAGALGVSEMTIRRDLAELEERGTARRVRGGAVAIGPRPFAERHRTHARAKAQIAAKLARFIPAEGAVAFDASSTVMRLASSLEGARDLTVLTNGPDTFAALQDRAGLTPLLTGGRLDPATGSLVGPIACRSAAQLTVRCFVCSAAAVGRDDGATEATLDEAEVKRALARGASEVVLAVDASKLERRAVAVALEWDEIDVLVTELDRRDKRLEPFRSLARIV